MNMIVFYILLQKELCAISIETHDVLCGVRLKKIVKKEHDQDVRNAVL
jgi:hypothetical protein